MEKQYATYGRLLKNALGHKIDISSSSTSIDGVEQDILDANYLRLHGIQEFIRNYAGPNTTNNRIVMMWDTGVGKTLGAISIAMEFIKYLRLESDRLYKAGEDQTHVGSVFIIGFTGSVFKRELMKHPDFGFISREELEQKAKLIKIAELGTQDDHDRLTEFNNMIKKRLTSRRRNGFFKFIGYRELVNHLFINTKGGDIANLDEQQIFEALKIGTVKINQALLDQFNNSMIICDEIHNVYNSAMKNNWGVALQVVLDKYPNIRAVFLSATPFNNSPTEIINLMNLLGVKLDKSDYFTGEELKPGALEKLRKVCQGKFSYIRDTDTRYMPKRVIVGEQLEGIPYLRFIRCPMSPFHYYTYKTVFTGALNQDERYLTEFALPNPENAGAEARIDKRTDISKLRLEPGLYKTEDVKYTIPDASPEWKQKMGIDANGESVDGRILHLSKIGVYSTKYKMMLREIVRLIRLGRGKILVFHPSVQVSGVTTIANALIVNGLLDETSPPGDETLCSYCGYSRSLHGKKSLPVEIISELIEDEILGGYGENVSEKDNGDGKMGGISNDIKHRKITGTAARARLTARFFETHEYQPARFILAHAKVDKNQLFYMRDKFNHESNLDGGRYKIMLGARMIKEGIDFTAVRNILIVARVDNISSLIQVIGRAVRRKSHIKLPPHQRSVYVKIFVSSEPDMKKLTYEEEKYKDKMKLYVTIQKIEQMIHEEAVDRCINAAPEQKLETLGPLPYKVKCSSSVDWSTFNAYYAENEVNLIIMMIKRFFLSNPVWSRDDLWHAVTHPPPDWDIAPSPSLFDKNNFLVACHKLTHGIFVKLPYLEALFNSSSRMIVDRENRAYGIYALGSADLFIRCPYIDGRLVLDIEQPFRIDNEDTGHENFIDISGYLQTKTLTDEYPFKKLKFRQKFEKVSIDDMDYAICEFGSEFHSMLLCDCIAYVFDSWTGKAKKSEYHDFYFKMLTFYDVIGVVIWADSAKDFVLEHYTQYIGKKAASASDSDIVRMLKSSINTWVPAEAKKKMASIMTMSAQMFDSKSHSSHSSHLVPPSQLPIGNAINKVPKFYKYEAGKDWTEVSNYIDHSVSQWIENDVLVGYDEKSKSGVHIRFKIRNPIQNVKQYKDTRKIERGTVCGSKSKEYLLGILKKIEGTIPPKVNVGNLCTAIRKALISREIAERKKGTNIKWFYHYFDQTRPDLVDSS